MVDKDSESAKKCPREIQTQINSLGVTAANNNSNVTDCTITSMSLFSSSNANHHNKYNDGNIVCINKNGKIDNNIKTENGLDEGDSHNHICRYMDTKMRSTKYNQKLEEGNKNNTNKNAFINKNRKILQPTENDITVNINKNNSEKVNSQLQTKTPIKAQAKPATNQIINQEIQYKKEQTQPQPQPQPPHQPHQSPPRQPPPYQQQSYPHHLQPHNQQSYHHHRHINHLKFQRPSYYNQNPRPMYECQLPIYPMGYSKNINPQSQQLKQLLEDKSKQHHLNSHQLVTVVVKSNMGNNCNITLGEWDSVWNLKIKISNRLGIDVSNQVLIYNDKQLDDDEKTMNYHGIVDWTIIRLIPNLQTGSMKRLYSSETIEEEDLHTLLAMYLPREQLVDVINQSRNNEIVSFVANINSKQLNVRIRAVRSYNYNNKNPTFVKPNKSFQKWLQDFKACSTSTANSANFDNHCNNYGYRTSISNNDKCNSNYKNYNNNKCNCNNNNIVGGRDQCSFLNRRNDNSLASHKQRMETFKRLRDKRKLKKAKDVNNKTSIHPSPNPNSNPNPNPNSNPNPNPNSNPNPNPNPNPNRNSIYKNNTSNARDVYLPHLPHQQRNNNSSNMYYQEIEAKRPKLIEKETATQFDNLSLTNNSSPVSEKENQVHSEEKNCEHFSTKVVMLNLLEKLAQKQKRKFNDSFQIIIN